MGISSAQAQPIAAASAKRRSVFGGTPTLLGIAGILSLALAVLVATGWLALGERANISRRDFNPLEIMVMVGGVLWGLFSLFTALQTARAQKSTVISDYFEKRSGFTPEILYVLLTLLFVGLVFAFLSEQVITGWIALGERINISRRELNWIEIAASVLAGFWAIVTFRTILAFLRREKPTPAWTQWVLFVSGLIAIVFILSSVFEPQSLLLPDRNIEQISGIPSPDSAADLGNLSLSDSFASTALTYRVFNAATILANLYAPALILLFSCLGAYQLVAAERHTRADQAIRNVLSRIPGAGAIVGFIVILIFFAVASDLFLEPRALAGALTTNITRGIVAIGLTLLMISGEFDLSVGSQLACIGLIFLLAMTEGVLGLPPMHIIPAMGVAFLFATLLGFINGMILIKTGIPSFIVTLGTLLAFRAIPLVIVSEGRILRYADYRLPAPNVELNSLVIIGLLVVMALIVGFIALRLIPRQFASLRGRISGYSTDTHDFRDFTLFTNALVLIVSIVSAVGALSLLILGILDLFNQGIQIITVNMFQFLNGQFWFLPADVNLRTGVLWWFLLVLVFQFILTQTPFGSYVFAVGGNPGAARAQGINTNAIKVLNFIICSWMVACAAIMDVARVQSVDSTRGDGLELEVIAASVIGGTLLNGGYGSIIGALLGVLIFGMLRTGLVLIGLNPRVFNGVIGVIIIVAVVINTFVRRERK